MNDLETLIERLEAATGPDRKLSADIAEALGLFPALFERRDNRGHPGWFSKSGQGWFALPYTASLDAAMTLVPEGWDWELRRNFVQIWPDREGGWLMERVNQSAATPTLALCAAALKARAAIAQGVTR